MILEVVLYDWSRGSGYSGSYAAPGTSNSGSAERRAEAEGVGRAEAAGAEGDGGGGSVDGKGGAERALLPIVEMDTCPCTPDLLFRDGDVYEEVEGEEEGEGGGLTLVRSDGGVVERGRGAGGGRGGGGVGQVEDVLTAGDLACDVGGLDGELEDIARRVLSTRSIPTEVCTYGRSLTRRGRDGGGSTYIRACVALLGGGQRVQGIRSFAGNVVVRLVCCWRGAAADASWVMAMFIALDPRPNSWCLLYCCY